MISSTPGPTAGSSPARMPCTSARAAAASRAARSVSEPVTSSVRCARRSVTWVWSSSARRVTSSRMRTSSSWRRLDRPSLRLAWTWTTRAKPSSAHSRPVMTWPRLPLGANERASVRQADRGSACRCRWSGGISGLQQVAPDGRGVREDPEPEEHDDGGRQLRPDPELVPKEHDQRGHHDVGQEGDHEHAVVEHAVEPVSYTHLTLPTIYH